MRYINIQKSLLKSIYIVGVSSTLLFGTAGHVSASELSLKVSPAIMTIRANPPADIRTPFVLENGGSTGLNVKVLMKRFKQTGLEDGKVQFLTDPEAKVVTDPDFFKKVQVIDDTFSVDTFSLGPKQKKELQLRITLPQNQPKADYYFSVLFVATPEDEEVVPEESNSTLVQQALGFNVLLTSGSKESPKTYIDEFKTSWYKESGPTEFTVEISNDGTQFVSPTGVILIKNMFGQTVGRIDLPKTNILAGSRRALTNYTLPNQPQPVDKTEVSKALWQEKFLLGWYRAELSLAVSETGPLYTKTVDFIAIPSKFLSGIGIAIVISILIILRIRKKLKNS